MRRLDAFLAVSGFLMTLSIGRRLERGSLSLTAYLARLLRRLLPPVLLVLAAVAVAGYLWTPAGQRTQLIRELLATLFYRENWELIASQLDYAAGPATSPLQHFWSLSVQGQFYLLWFFLLAGAAWLGRRIGWSVGASVLAAVTLATVISFMWHTLWLSRDPQVAYLHTGGRIWELGLGGIVALLVPRLMLGLRSRVVLGWIGVALVVSCGFVLDGKALFPGIWALWPVGGVLLVLVAGATDAPFSADRLLGPQDKPKIYDLDDCVNTHRDTPESAIPSLCLLGPADARHTVLVTGGSHVTQWMPAIELIAEQEGWRLAFTEKGGCQFLPRPAQGSGAGADAELLRLQREPLADHRGAPPRLPVHDRFDLPAGERGGDAREICGILATAR